MSFLAYQRMVIAYHGCDQSVVRSVLRGGRLKSSANEYDWLGTGIYFWEHGPGRALEWARFMKKRGRVAKPAVLGAIVHLGNCLDLLDVRITRQLREAYPVFRSQMSRGGFGLPSNDPEKKKHSLDCAFLNWAIPFLERSNGAAYHTVRGVFIEGVPLFPTAQIHAESHIQLAVRDSSAIVGYFRPADT